MSSNKYYVVWKGFATGVFDSWEEAEIQVSGFPGAQYRSYKNQEEAVEAFRKGYDQEGLIQEVNKQIAELNRQGHKIEWNNTPSTNTTQSSPQTFIRRAIAVDGACGGNPGPGEYRGVYVETVKELFHFGPIEGATNNIMEFLAIVHGLGYLEKQKLYIPIYSDSVSAQAWVRNAKCKTTITPNETNSQLIELIERAETWLRTHSFRVNIYKWDTKAWGEIPADFGRK